MGNLTRLHRDLETLLISMIMILIERVLIRAQYQRTQIIWTMRMVEVPITMRVDARETLLTIKTVIITISINQATILMKVRNHHWETLTLSIITTTSNISHPPSIKTNNYHIHLQIWAVPWETVIINHKILTHLATQETVEALNIIQAHLTIMQIIALLIIMLLAQGLVPCSHSVLPRPMASQAIVKETDTMLANSRLIIVMCIMSIKRVWVMVTQLVVSSKDTEAVIKQQTQII